MLNITRILKGLSIFKEGVLNPSAVNILPGGANGTTTTLQGAQTANRTVTLPDNTGTVLTTASVIDVDQLEALTTNRVVITDFTTGKLDVAVCEADQLVYLENVTSDIQGQIDVVSGDLSTETAARIAADSALSTSKANVTLNNILPVVAVNVNGQKVTNAGTPTVASDLTTKAYVDAAVTGGGANLTLSNLGTTAINTNLIPATSATSTLGTASKTWNKLYVESIEGASPSNAKIVVSNQNMFDFSNNLSLNWNTRKLYDSASGERLDWSGTDLDVKTSKIINVVDPTSAQDAATKTYVDSRVQNIFSSVCINGGSSLPATSTNYISPSIGLMSYVGTESYRNMLMPTSGTLKNLYVNMGGGGQDASGSLVFTVRKNGADTTLVVTVPAGSSTTLFSDTSHTVTFVAGDLISIKVRNNASTGSENIYAISLLATF